MPTFTETTDAAAGIGTAYTLGVGQSAQGTLSTGADHDWYAVNVVAGTTYTFSLSGTGTNNVNDTFLNLYNATGTTVLASNDDGLQGLNSRITYTATTTGRVYLDAGSYAGLSAGQYTLSVANSTRPTFDITQAGGSLDGDASWSTVGTAATVTWGFRATAATYTASGSNIASFTRLSGAQQTVIQSLLNLWSSVCNVTFTQVAPGGFTDSATMLIGNYTDATDGAGAFAYFPGDTTANGATSAGDVWLNTDSISTTSLPASSYDYFAIMHEFGHALGLSHPGDYNAAPGLSITYAANAEFAQDSQQYTIMSYFTGSDTGADLGGYPTTPMLYDIYETQLIYGANMTTRTGNTVYGFNNTAGEPYTFAAGARAYCIWDAGGTDTLDCSGFSQTQTITLVSGEFSSIGGLTSNISIAFGAVVENAIGGSGADTITGNAAANNLSGASGADSLYGGDGADRLDGGIGIDSLYGGAGNDTIVYDGSDNLANVLGGADTDLLLIINGTAPTSFNLTSHQFELAQVLTTNDATFRSRTDSYNSSWQLTQQDTTNLDNSTTATQFDIANVQTWSQVNTYNNAAAQTYLQSVLFDDNSAQTNSFDPTNIQTWRTAVTYYDTQRRTTLNSVANDDNTSRATYYDASSVQTWISADTFYDTQNRTTLQSIANDNGTSQVQYWDTTNTQNWSTAVLFYNAAGTLTRTTGVYDAGGTFSF